MAKRHTENARIGLLWRGDPARPAPPPGETRLRAFFDEFAARGAEAAAVIYAEEAHDLVREQLLSLDGVLVWVDPIVRGRERLALDALLREVATQGVFVSAHPDVIRRMGTKEVLYRTRGLPWGGDIQLYRTPGELLAGLLGALRSTGPRVLKQNRGSGGNGVWRVELVRDEESAADALLRVQPAERGASVVEMCLGDFVAERMPYFDAFGGTGCFVDQPYQDRIGEGMIRAYISGDRVAGFGHQFVTALAPLPEGAVETPAPPPRYYFAPDKPEFQDLRRKLESGWVAEMQELCGVATSELPAIWDADFLLGPRTAAEEDTYVLCEINISGVFPIPHEAVAPLVTWTLTHVAG
ncbi:MAG: Cj0069 family protein [Dehalococcoidia bacterium]|nr:Cj0069 family protein [Dehalococcoidia bacterium]